MTSPAEYARLVYRNNVLARNKTARNGHGTPYPVDAEELRILQDASFGPRSSGGRLYPGWWISVEEAFQRLFQPAANNADTNEKRQRIHRTVQSLQQSQKLTWDLVIKMFPDIDACYFHGDLRRRVHLCWRTFPDYQCGGGLTIWPGFQGGSNPRVRISLRTDMKWESLPNTFALALLVHEMIHAYFLVHCGHPGALEMAAQDPAHGPLFVAAAERLERMMGFHISVRLEFDLPQLAREEVMGQQRDRLLVPQIRPQNFFNWNPYLPV